MDDHPHHDAQWALLGPYLANATPEQRHRFVARSNYDGNHHALAWLAAQPDLDQATALMMYWSLGAAWFVQYADAAAVRDHERDTHDLLRSIEQRYLHGFYADHGLSFDPWHWEGAGPGDYLELPVRTPVPPAMLLAVEGTIHVDPFDEVGDAHYDEGVPLALAGELQAACDDAPATPLPALGDEVAGHVDVWATQQPPALSPPISKNSPGWDVLLPFLEQSSPQQRHQLMLYADADGLGDALQWLLEQPTLSAASAMALYWNLGASWYVAYSTPNEVPTSHRHTASVLHCIEARLAAGFYADHGIGFDLAVNRPRYPAQWPGRALRRPVPALLCAPLPGRLETESDDVHFINGLPEDVAEAWEGAKRE